MTTQVNETVTEGLKRELTVTIPSGDLDQRLSSKLEELKSQARIKGFRPGKVPVSHLRKVYGKAAMAEIVQALVSETSQIALSDRGEKAATEPDIAMTEDTDEAEKILSGVADLVFTMAYEIVPDFELSDFKNLALERLTAAVTDEAIDARLQQIGEGNRPYAGVDRAVKADDRVTLSYLGKIEGEPFEGGSSDETQLVIGSGQFIPGFEDALVGSKPGDKKAVDLTFPDHYPAEHLAGKSATFDVEIKAVEEPGEIAINDEFATNLGIESLEKLKEAVTKQIETEYGDGSRQRIKRQILDTLDEKYDFPLPEKLVNQEFDNVWNQVMHDIEHHSRSFEDEGTTEEEAKKEYQTIAERRVRLGLVLSRIGEDADVNITEEELQQAMVAQLRQYPGQEQQVMDFYKNNPSAVQALRAPIFEDKVIDYILEFADVTEKEVPSEELLADDEDGENGEHHHAHSH